MSGCSFLDSNYVKPTVNLPNKWAAQDPGTKINTQVNLPDLAWWQEFDDPVLANLIKVALEHNNQVQIALANLDYAKGQLKQVQLNWLPNLSFLAGYSSFPAFGGIDYFFGLMPSYTLNIFAQLKQQKQAKYLVEASTYAKDSARLTVIGQVAASYFSLSAQTEQRQLYQQLLADMTKQLTLYQSQFKSGLIDLSKIDDLQSQIKQVKAQTNIVEHNWIVSQNALRFLANQNPGPVELTKGFSQLDGNKIVLGTLPLNVVNNRPDVKHAEAMLKAASANIGLAHSQLLPSVNLASFFLDSTHSLTKAGTPTNLNQAYATLPILNAPALGQIAASNASFKAAYYEYVQTIRGVLRDVDNDLSAHNWYSQQFKDNLSAMAELVNSCKLEQSRYKNGISSRIEVVNCQIKIDSLALTLNQNKLQLLMTIVALYQDLAGGYNAAPNGQINKKH